MSTDNKPVLSLLSASTEMVHRLGCKRVLSLLSASTEIVHRLGCAHLLVGRSHGCDDPPLATALPVVTAPRVDPNAPSLELDKAVRAQAAAGGPIYQIRSELVRTLNPDVIITQEQCRICAVTPEDVNAACMALSSTTLVTIMPITLDNVLGDVTTIAGALGVPERGRRLVAHMRARLDAIAPLVPASDEPPPRVAHLEWLAPLMGSGYWIAECVEAAGCTMVHGTKGGHSMAIERVSMLANADVILLAPCGFSLERTHAELASLALLQLDEWRALPAVKNDAVVVADGNLYFNRSSCGVVEAAEIVAEAAHAELRGLFGHHGRRWVMLSELDAFCAREGAASPTKPVVLASGVEAAAAEDGGGTPRAKVTKPPGTDQATPSAHVNAQLKALSDGDFASAFALNSAANRARLNGATKFEAIVKGSPSFGVLLHASTTCVVREGEGGAGIAADAAVAAVRVQATAAAGDVEEVHFVFDLSRSSAGKWETDGVRIEC